MKPLHLFLEGVWFDKIDSGEKTSEYRARRSSGYWQKRILPYVDAMLKGPQHVCFHRGYTNKQRIMFTIKDIIFHSNTIEIQLGDRVNELDMARILDESAA